MLGTAAAILLNQNFWGRAVVRSITLIPWVVPGIVAATTWAWMFHTEFGIINYMLTGAHRDPTRRSAGSPTANTVMPVLIAINVWKLFPFVAIMVLAGLQSIPNDLYEAARVDGANFWDEVWHIMLPQRAAGADRGDAAAGHLGRSIRSPSSMPSPRAGRPTRR